MFGSLFGITCIRPGCGHKNPKAAEFCESCGISLAFNRPAILDGNAWQPAPDELAAFFKFKDMKKGFFTKTLWVPAGMKAWVLQDDDKQPVLLLAEGAHTTETLFQRMNNFFRSPVGDVLVARTGSVPLSFAFDDVLSLERLSLKATLTLRVRVRVGEDKDRPDLAAFRRHFMQQPGVVTAEQLTRPDLLGKSVLAALKSYVGGRGIDEMAANADLATELDTHLRNRLGALLLDLGLELVEPSEFTLHHQKLDEHNRLQGELWLLRREKGLQHKHTAALNDLYDAEEREKLYARRQEILRKKTSGELDEEDADLAHAMRLRQVQQYERILAAGTREQAARMGAADEVAQLEQEYAAKRRVRERTADIDQRQQQTDDEAFAQIKALARIKQDSELEIERLKASSLLALERERAARELDALQRLRVLDRAAHDQDEANRQTAREQQELIEQERRGLQFELESRRHAIEMADLGFAAEIRQRETLRLQAWEDEQTLDRIRKLRAEAAAAASDQSIDISRKWMLLRRERELHQQEDELNRAVQAHERSEATARRAFDEARALEADKRQAAAEAAEAKRREYAQIGALPVEAMIAITQSGVNVQALVDTVRIKAQSQMSPEQIQAMQSGKPASPAGSPGADGAFMRAFSEQLAAVVKTMQESQSVHHDQATSNLLRMHEGSQAALLKALDTVAKVALGHAPVAAAMPEPAAPVPPPPVVHLVASAGAGKCPKCRATVEPHQHWCTKCGTELPESAVPVARPPAAPGGVKCPRCRETSHAAANYCWSCGHAFGE